MIRNPLGAYVAFAFGALCVSLPAAPPPPGYTGSCTTSDCHNNYLKRRSVHGPVAQGACDACHEQADDGRHAYTLTAEGAELCLDCHDEDDFPGSVRHTPFEQGECSVCHDPHASDGPTLLQADTIGELCAECHDEVTDEPSHLHGPVAAGECTSCHNPHATEHPSLLFAEAKDICAKCHVDLLARIAKGTFVHEPVREDCLVCHNPHGGETRMVLNSTVPELCVDCHDEVGEAIEDATVPHQAVTIGRTCLNCHDPHASGFDHGLRLASMDVCLGCHNEPLGKGKRTLANIQSELEKGSRHHGPIGQKDCTACHMPHGGEHFRLLIGEYPVRFYAPFDEDRYALCFDCHDVELLEDEETDEATGFRNGERNLHFLHVNRAIKGRTCRACHEPHAGTKSKMIADSVPFGDWDIPINFVQTETGGSCAPGCHRSYGYDRDLRVQNFKIAQAEP